MVSGHRLENKEIIDALKKLPKDSALSIKKLNEYKREGKLDCDIIRIDEQKHLEIIGDM